MIVIYSPKDGDGDQYDAEELTCGEADAVCRATDMPWAQVGQALRNQDPGALRAVAWAWRKRADPTLRLAHFDPPLKALKARFSAEEIPDLLDQADRTPQFTAEERAQIRTEVVALAVDEAAALAAVEAHDNPPKAQVPPSADLDAASPLGELSTSS